MPVGGKDTEESLFGGVIAIDPLDFKGDLEWNG